MQGIIFGNDSTALFCLILSVNGTMTDYTISVLMAKFWFHHFLGFERTRIKDAKLNTGKSPASLLICVARHWWIACVHAFHIRSSPFMGPFIHLMDLVDNKIDKIYH